MKYDSIVAGAGFSGATIARKLAEAGKKVLVCERRKQVSGNMYDEYDENGILVQKYGPHIFHTNSDAVWQFVCRFSAMKEYRLKCSAEIDGKMVPSPFNFTAIDLLYDKEDGTRIKTQLQKEYGDRKAVTIVEMLNSSNAVVRSYAEMLFEKDYRPYTAKQWGLKPEEIDVSVLNRVPVLLDDRDTFFNDTYEALPEKGYTEMFHNMLDHPNITTILETDAIPRLRLDAANKKLYWDDSIFTGDFVFTGAIDELSGYKYGKLPYRALWFDYKTLPADRYIGHTPIAVYPQREGYTRITEYKWLQQQHAEGITKIATEYPLTYVKGDEKAGEPYYPVISDANTGLYRKYKEDLSVFDRLYLCGRLAEYKYYNMDDVIVRAFEVADEIINGDEK